MSKKTLNITNLEALGAARLAALLMEVSTGSADIKRRVRLELSHNLGATELAHDVRKRLVALRKATTFVGWRKRKALIKDLETQVAMITDKIAPEDANAAFDLLWDFIAIAPFVYGRVDDSKGDVGDVFRAAVEHFDTIAPRAMLDPKALALRVWGVVQDNGYGEWDGIIARLAPTLGAAGLAHLKQAIEDYATEPVDSGANDHEAIQFLRQLRGGDNYAAERTARFVKSCLQEIAEAEGDTTAYIAQYSDQDLRRKDIAAEVAMLLLDDGKPQEALDLLEAVDQDGHTLGQDAWDVAIIASLTALGQHDAAQARRWDIFAATLNADHLRDYLKRLPDFEDIDAEDRARAHVLVFPQFSAALRFCITWPDLLSAAQLVEHRRAEINGNHYARLSPAADALRARHPFAAVLLWRAMIDYTLEQAIASRYGHAADHLADCAACDAEISDYGDVPTHADYLQVLQNRHLRKASFWTKVTG